jgi:hypothetical protein
MMNVLRDGDTVARYGGDEFVVLADGLGSDECRGLLDRLRTVVTAPIRIEGRLIRVDASFGTAWAACGTAVKDVLNTADRRMYEEKRARAKAVRPEPQRTVVAERRVAGPLPERPVGPWVPHRPAVAPKAVRTWRTEGPVPAAQATEVEVRSGEELARLADTAHVHRVVLRGAIDDLSVLRRLPALRSLVITDNPVLSYLDELEGCRGLRFLTVTGCGSLRDWVGAARTGVMFVDVGPGHAVPALKGLTEAGRLRRLTLRGTLADDDPDLLELRRSLPEVQVRVAAGPTG